MMRLCHKLAIFFRGGLLKRAEEDKNEYGDIDYMAMMRMLKTNGMFKTMHRITF